MSVVFREKQAKKETQCILGYTAEQIHTLGVCKIYNSLLKGCMECSNNKWFYLQTAINSTPINVPNNLPANLPNNGE